MKKFAYIFLSLLLLIGTTVAVSTATAAKPTPTKKVSQQKKQTNKKPVKKPAKKPVKKTLGARTLSFIPFSGYIKCVGPDGKTAYAPKKDCDNLWNYWNNHKPSTPNNNNNGNNNNNSSNNNSNNSSNNSNSETPTTTPNPTPTEIPLPNQLYTIKGNVYVDTNGNEVKDEGERSISDITVFIGDGRLNTNTDSSGNYYFSNLKEGTYGLDIADIDYNYLGNRKIISLTQDTILNFGLTQIEKPSVVIDPSVHKISGRVFIDTNNNGIQEQNEVNIRTVGVKLSGTKEMQEYSSNFTGYYVFPDLVPGPYTLTMEPPYDHTATTPNPVNVNLTQDTIVNFGIKQIPAYTLTGNVYIDSNINGVKDNGESNFKDALIDLYVPTWKQGRTDTNGNYEITDIKAGTYELSLQVPTGYYFPTSNPTEIVITDNTIVNFGLIPLPTSTPTPYLSPMPTVTPDLRPRYSISGNIFIDANGNGLKDQNDQNLRNLYLKIGKDRIHTNDWGQYFISKPEGVYLVSVELPDGYISTTPSNFLVGLTQDIAINFGVTLDPNITPEKIPFGYMQIHNAYVLPCTSSSCAGITTIIVEGINIPDDAYIYLYRISPNLPGTPNAYSPVSGNATIVDRFDDTKITTDFINVACGDYYLNVFSPKYAMSGNQYNIDLKPYICD